MRLQAVRECGRVVDFVWQSASQAAAHLLHREPQALLGLCLRQVIVAGRRGHPTLTDRYRRVLEDGRALAFNQAQLFQGWQEILIHRVVPAGDGVRVSLISLSANRRAQIARLQASAV